MRSIRIYLLVGLMASVALANFLAALQGYKTGLEQTQTLLDEQLMHMAVLLTHTIDDDKVSPATINTMSAGRRFAFQVGDAQGRLLLHSDQAPEELFYMGDSGYSEHNFSGYRWRVFVYQGGDRHLRAMVALPIDEQLRVAEGIALASMLPTVAVLPLLAVLLWLLLGRGLRPLRSLTQAVESKRAEDLSPLEIAETTSELKPLLDSSNQFLSRLAQAFEREQRFTADAAHELRTPLAGLKLHAHNLLQELGDDHVIAGQLKQGLDRLAHLTEQILDLYRANPEQLKARFKTLDLHDQAQQSIARHYPMIAQKQQTIELLGEVQTILADEISLGLLIDNLLVNASKYTPQGGKIRLETVTDNLRSCLLVSDSGPGVAVQERERIFSRFYRGGGDRHDSGVIGCGLGLAIVQHIANVHGAQIEVADSDFASGLQVKVCFEGLEDG